MNKLSILLFQTGTFLLFCGLSILGTIVLYFILPETRGITLEEAEGIFMSADFKRKYKHEHKDKIHDKYSCTYGAVN